MQATVSVHVESGGVEAAPLHRYIADKGRGATVPLIWSRGPGDEAAGGAAGPPVQCAKVIYLCDCCSSAYDMLARLSISRGLTRTLRLGNWGERVRSMSTGPSPMRLVSVNTVPERAAKVIGEFTSRASPKYDIKHIGNVTSESCTIPETTIAYTQPAIDEVQPYLRSFDPPPDMLVR